MKYLWSAVALAALSLTPRAGADDTPKAEAKPVLVPYRLTAPKHVLIRAKINGKGPFNFILDTGAPAVFITKKVAETVGVKPDAKGWGAFERFEIEGGLVVADAKGRVEDLFQLEGMNGLGLAGAEVHGVIGYNVIARYRIEFDFTKDKLVWTPLDFEPKGPMGVGGKGGGGAGLEAIGQIMKMLGGALGKKATPDVVFRGYVGLDLSDKDEIVTVRAVLPNSPAALAGVKPGDKLKKFKDRSVLNVEDVERFARKLKAGEEVQLTIERGVETMIITLKTAEGL
jgi:serine protease DegQ